MLTLFSMTGDVMPSTFVIAGTVSWRALFVSFRAQREIHCVDASLRSAWQARCHSERERGIQYGCFTALSMTRWWMLHSALLRLAWRCILQES